MGSRNDDLAAAQRELSVAVTGLTAAVGELRGEMRSVDSRMESVFWKQTLAAAATMIAAVGLAVAIIFGLVELL